MLNITYSFSLSNKKHNMLIGALFLILMTLLFSIYTNLNLKAPIPEIVGFTLHLLSLSAGNPTFVISCIILMGIGYFVRHSYKQLLGVYIQFALILALSFVLKSTVKFVTEVPRPFTHELVTQKLIDSPTLFYQLTESQKIDVINIASVKVPRYRIANWQGETNFSFPSGHTIFVATCVVFWGGLFLREKRYLLSATITGWAIGVAFSRYWLGMHWPEDILMSIFCASLLMLVIPDVKIKKYN